MKHLLLVSTLFVSQFALAQTNKVAASLIYSDGQPLFTANVVSGDADSDLATGEPVTTSKVTLKGANEMLELPSMQPGLHMMVPGLGPTLNFAAGETYTLEVDPEGDGTVNASAGLVMPGTPVLSIKDGATLAGDFSLSWQDPVAGTAKYDPVYVVSVDDGNSGFGVTCGFVTKETDFTVSSEHCSDGKSQGLDVLPSKNYSVSVSVFVGSDPRSSDVQRNLIGDNVTGLFSITQISEINIAVK
jgi:hypothetical protein